MAETTQCCWCDSDAADPPLVYYDVDHPVCDACREDMGDWRLLSDIPKK